jgi:hypothetical protein
MQYPCGIPRDFQGALRNYHGFGIQQGRSGFILLPDPFSLPRSQFAAAVIFASR